MTAAQIDPAERRCTWCHKDVRCERTAKHEQVGKAGNLWADLCDEHAAELDASLGDPKRSLAAWAKAAGGAKKLAREMADAAAPLMAALVKKLKEKR